MDESIYAPRISTATNAENPKLEPGGPHNTLTPLVPGFIPLAERLLLVTVLADIMRVNLAGIHVAQSTFIGDRTHLLAQCMRMEEACTAFVNALQDEVFMGKGTDGNELRNISHHGLRDWRRLQEKSVADGSESRLGHTHMAHPGLTHRFRTILILSIFALSWCWGLGLIIKECRAPTVPGTIHGGALRIPTAPAADIVMDTPIEVVGGGASGDGASSESRSVTTSFLTVVNAVLDGLVMDC